MEKICSNETKGTTNNDSNNENEDISDDSSPIKKDIKKKRKKSNIKKKVKKKKVEDEPLREIQSIFDMEYFKDIPKDTFDHDIVFARFIIFMRKAIMHVKKDYCEKNNIRYVKNLYLKEETLEFLIDETNAEESAIRNIVNEENELTLKLALKDLSMTQRLVIDLFYFQNMNIDEIAKELEISFQAVYGLKSRAEKKLKKAFIYYGGKYNV